MSSSPDAVAVDSSFLACRCLNVKLHLPSSIDNVDLLSGTSVQLGLGGVSVEQKILGVLTLSPEGAIVSCSNCNQDVYSFDPDNATVKLNKTSIAFLTPGVSFSPSNGRVIPHQGLIAGKQAIEEALTHPHYSHAFRLVLPPISDIDGQDATTSSSPTTFLPSYLQRIRSILDQELEANLVAQEQRTLARIAAFKSQQLAALEASQQKTVQEKERLWHTIQQRVAPPSMTPSSSSSEDSLQQHQQQPSVGDANNATTASDTQSSVHPFDFPSTLPIRFSTDNIGGTNAGSILQRWRKPVQTDVATSLQLKEFDDRMHSIGMRRQSRVPGPLPQYERASPTAEDLAASEALSSQVRKQDRQEEAPANQEGGSSGGVDDSNRVSYGIGAAQHITIVEPAAAPLTEDHTTADNLGYDEDEEDDDDDGDGVVFDLDEELGFDHTGLAAQQQDNSVVTHPVNGAGPDENGGDDDDDDDNDDEESSAAGTVAGAGTAGKGGPSSSMVAGSLRLNYLRRQKKLEAERQKIRSEEKRLDEELRRQPSDDEDDYNSGPKTTFGTSLPIQIHRPPLGSVSKSTNSNAASTKATAALTYAARKSSISMANPSWTHASQAAPFNPPEQLQLPPASSPAGEMLRRRLSRTYGPAKDVASLLSLDPSKTSSASPSATAQPSGIAVAIPNDLYTGSGMIAIDPFMLLDDDEDDDENFAGNTTVSTADTAYHKDRNGFTSGAGAASQPLSTSRARSAQPGFEPPHILSARSYVGETPWEMPTRVTVKPGGVEREGKDLDLQLTLQMAREIEEEKRHERAGLREATRRRKQQGSGTNAGGGGGPSAVDIIREENEEEEREQAEENTSKPRGT